MSEPLPSPVSGPSLPSTADATPYVPVSWVAATAAAVAVAFLLTLGLFGWFAFTNKKPLIEPGLLAMPAVALVLCFAARRVVRNSEGTRTDLLYGVNLVNTAWWLALVLGLCYIAYLFAIDYAIRREARGEVERWIGFLKVGTEDDLGRAFHRTLPPGRRQDVSPTDQERLQARFRDELLMFRNSDLVRLAQRNKGDFEFDAGGVTWAHRPGVVECVVTGTAKCPEGSFPVMISLRGVEGGAGRQWVIMPPQAGGFVDQSRAARTHYGHLVQFLEFNGAAFGKGYLAALSGGPLGHQYAYRAFVAPGGDAPGWGAVAFNPRDPREQFLWQLAFAMPSAAFGDAGYAEYMNTQFLKTPRGGDPTPAQKAKFLTSWDAFGLRPAGEKLKGPDGGPVDKENVITLTETAVEVRVPVEIANLAPDEPGKKPGTARGRMLIVCDDPPLLALLRRHRGAADAARGATDFPADLADEVGQLYRDRADPKKLVIPWRVVRVESNLEPVVIDQQGGPGGGPGGGGLGGPGG